MRLAVQHRLANFVIRRLPEIGQPDVIVAVLKSRMDRGHVDLLAHDCDHVRAALAKGAEREPNRGSDSPANQPLDVVELHARHRLAVDADDFVARFHSGMEGRRALDRLDEDALGARVLYDVHADAAEVAAFERLLEASDFAGR